MMKIKRKMHLLIKEKEPNSRKEFRNKLTNLINNKRREVQIFRNLKVVQSLNQNLSRRNS